MRNRVTQLLSIVSLAGSIALSAPTTQTLPAANVIGGDTFEVASIRPAGLQAPVPCSGFFEATPGRITFNAATVYQLISLAYGKACITANNLGLISGGPDWLKKETFIIQATMPKGTTPYTFQQLNSGEAPKVQAMLRNLLADRFHLVLHRTSKDGPIYNVYFVREGRINLSADQTKPFQPANPVASPLEIKTDRVTGTVGLRAKSIRIGVVMNALQLRDSRFVIDKTGLTGLYDVQDSIIDVGPSAPDVNVWPQVMEYLGFKLEATRGPIESIVIDRIEKPTEN
jgi:uncharacterized protein (TIGR03435 family)